MNKFDEKEMSSPELSVGLAVFKTYGPKGIDWVWHKLVGKRILICGVEGSGKSTFARYLKTRRLLPPQKRRRTRSPQKIKDLKIVIGENNHTFRITNSYDYPGQYGALEQSRSVISRRPHFLVIFLDVSNIKASLDWFTSFCSNLNYELGQYTSISKRILDVMIVLNKRDMINSSSNYEDQKIYDDFRDEVLDVFMDYLKDSYVRKDKVEKVPTILPGIMVRSKNDDSMLADDVILTMANFVN